MLQLVAYFCVLKSVDVFVLTFDAFILISRLGFQLCEDGLQTLCEDYPLHF